MPTPKKGPRLAGSPSHQRHLLANLATALFEHGRVTTTEARARLLRPYAEKLITKAKKGDLASRRAVNKVIRKQRLTADARLNNDVQYKLHTEIAPMFADRPGGYTRITKIGPRKGDNAPMAVIELVTEPYAPQPARPSRPAGSATGAGVTGTGAATGGAATGGAATGGAATGGAATAADESVADETAEVEPAAEAAGEPTADETAEVEPAGVAGPAAEAEPAADAEPTADEAAPSGRAASGPAAAEEPGDR